jgi:hypothetical protein
MQLLHWQCGDKMILLFGQAAKNAPVFSELTSPFLEIGGNSPQYPEFEPRTVWSQCVHIGFQRSRSHPAVSGYRQTGEISRYLFQVKLLKPTAAAGADDPLNSGVTGHRAIVVALLRS